MVTIIRVVPIPVSIIIITVPRPTSRWASAPRRGLLPTIVLTTPAVTICLWILVIIWRVRSWWFPPASDGATLVGGYVGDLRPVISETGSLLSTGAFPSGSSISHISWLGSAGLDALADANDGNGAEYLTSVDGGMTAVAVWTIGIGIGPVVSRSLLILMFMDSVCNCWAFICSLCCLMMDSSWDICSLRCSSWRS